MVPVSVLVVQPSIVERIDHPLWFVYIASWIWAIEIVCVRHKFARQELAQVVDKPKPRNAEFAALYEHKPLVTQYRP